MSKTLVRQSQPDSPKDDQQKDQADQNEPALAAPVSSDNSVSGWKFTGTAADPDSQPADRANHATFTPIIWSGDSLVPRKKSVIWYISLVVVTAIAAALVYLLTSDKISTGVIIAVALVFGISASHHPKNLSYQLDDDSITVGKKLYSFDSFRSFAVIDENGYSSIYMTPLKRFLPPLIIYVSPENESQIVSMLGERLPFSPAKSDPIDSLMRRIHF